jgi:hypothetical protein
MVPGTGGTQFASCAQYGQQVRGPEVTTSHLLHAHAPLHPHSFSMLPPHFIYIYTLTISWPAC